MRGPTLSPVASGLLGAALFGLSVPASRALLDGRGLSPAALAGLLYLSAGGALAAVRLPRGPLLADLPAPARRRLAVVALVGGVAAPLALTHGLTRVEAQVAALLLSLEGALTAVLAAAFFREHVGRQVGLAVALAAAGAVTLAEPWGAPAGRPDLAGVLLVLGAALGWALDNNLSRGLGDRDPVQVAAGKGLLAGPLCLGLAAARGEPLPLDPVTLGGAALVGVLSYGLSLTLVLRALAGLGAARAMTLFATGPIFGAAGAWLALGERPVVATAGAALLLMASVLVLLRERHEHEHLHPEAEHDHPHAHATDDAHHDHAHPDPPGSAAPGPHWHPHRHAPRRHSHRHTPDLHHDHGHQAPPAGGPG